MMVFFFFFQDFRLFSLKIGQNIASKTDYDKKLAADCLRKAGFNRTDLRQADLNQDDLNTILVQMKECSKQNKFYRELTNLTKGR